MPDPIKAPDTSAWTIDFVLAEKDLPAAIFCPGLTGTNAITMKALTTGSSFSTITEDGSNRVLTINHNREPIYEPGHYQLSKAGSDSVGAYLSTPGFP